MHTITGKRFHRTYTVLYDGAILYSTVFGTIPTNGAEYRYRNGHFISATELTVLYVVWFYVYNEVNAGKFAFTVTLLINNGNQRFGKVQVTTVLKNNRFKFK